MKVGRTRFDLTHLNETLDFNSIAAFEERTRSSDLLSGLSFAEPAWSSG